MQGVKDFRFSGAGTTSMGLAAAGLVLGFVL
jgi:hypothetical protein